MSIHTQDETTRSQPHRRVERILKGMGISFESEVSYPPYSIDIYLGEWHCGLEIDGPHHNEKKDGIRDAKLLQQYFVPIMHIPSEGLTAEDIKHSIIAFIEAAAPHAEERKRGYKATL